MSNGFLGANSRFKQGPDKRLVDSAFSYELECSKYMMQGLSFADLSHVMTLHHSGVLSDDNTKLLLKGLLEVHAQGEQAIALDPEVGDSYNNRDRYLQKQLGKVSGYIHIGRARREASTIAWQLVCKEKLIELHKYVIQLGNVFNNVIGEHLDTYMADFTYLQHAQPTTLGHYLQGFQMPLMRDLDRIERAINRVNQSPACSGSVNGSQIPMNRHFIADLLEFEGVMTHTRDAMWAPDICLDIMLGLSSIMTSLNRISEEFIIWNSAEFSYLELADGFTRTSVIMPQKKNPYGLAFIRGQARSFNGVMSAVLSTNQTISGQPDNRLYAYGEIPRSIDYAIQCVDLFAGILETATFNKKRLAEAANDPFIVATDLCDMLVKHSDIDNRSAHKVVGRAVRNAYESGDYGFSIESIKQAASQLEIELPAIPVDVFEANFDIASLMSLREGLGSANPEQVKMTIKQNEQSLEHAESVQQKYQIGGFEKRVLTKTEDYLKRLEGEK
ncbi:argininosuccinate lyase [Pseudoalteromonas sp. NZS100]|uniref:argininosuccinate lyase n=1 Tax=Pseudoalteromonas sp. NZS100 TaxID=2792046 RepID=UPI0018CE30A5|nr:argininosuccinate lyase [Pseudoalteromonas sp. NZS100]MBH0067363.1 argininosuccinate lyase [Pseudoalteromonas sp. NZS100]